MKLNTWLILPLVLLALPLAGQQEDDRAAIAVATAKALRVDRDLPKGATGFISAPGMEEATRAAARALGGHVTTREAAIRCGKLPSTCDLVDAVVLIRVPEPAISGKSAQVLATVWFETRSARDPVAVRTIMVNLQREENGWIVTDQQLRVMT
jgi:hypothetical protein